MTFDNGQVAGFASDTGGFILQNFYDEGWAGNFMMQMIVHDLDAWWAHIQNLDLAKTFGVREAQSTGHAALGSARGAPHRPIRRTLARGAEAGRMTAQPLRISNPDARRLWLASLGLDGERLDPLATIRRLGFVQLDTIQVVSRAQHHLLWSRNPSYRRTHARQAPAPAGGVRALHPRRLRPADRDLSLLAPPLRPAKPGCSAGPASSLRPNWPPSPTASATTEALSTHAFDSEVEGPRQMWTRPPHKRMLDYLWYAGVLATARRDGFTKVYDLTERVIPADVLADQKSEAEQIDWLCRQALEHMAFGDAGDIQRFWGAVSLAEAKAWLDRQTDLVPVEIEGADGSWKKAWGAADIEARLQTAPAPSGLKILNPFDPVIRERARLARLFGFDYTIEIFVPAAKRAFGYYVYPLLEGDRFIGRMEAVGDRKAGVLKAGRLWLEPGIRWTKVRQVKLSAELSRFGRLAGLSETTEPNLVL